MADLDPWQSCEKCGNLPRDHVLTLDPAWLYSWRAERICSVRHSGYILGESA